MAFLKFTADKTVKRLRWVMVGTILFDKLDTLLGQPGGYWQHPQAADEINRGWHYALSRSLPFYCLISLVTILILVLIVSVVPRRIALVAMLTAILNHFFGASFWLCYRFHFGTAGPLIYGIILSVILTLLVFPTVCKASPDTVLSREPDA